MQQYATSGADINLMFSLAILSSCAYRDITGAQHTAYGAKPGEYSIPQVYYSKENHVGKGQR